MAERRLPAAPPSPTPPPVTFILSCADAGLTGAVLEPGRGKTLVTP